MSAMENAAPLTFQKLGYHYGNTRALNNINLEINAGELVTIVGPSGCGKSTLLRIVAGLLHASEGSFLLDGEDVTHLPPEKRRIGWMPQSYALFEHLNVADNVAFGLKMRGDSITARQARVAEVLHLCRIDDLANRPVTALSGGQKQRVAIARALAIRPRVLLLDEPLAALDPQLRIELRSSLEQLLRQSGVTTLFVTHDQHEALALADRVVILRAGKLEQFDTPEALWQRPASEFVASFIGQAVVLKTKRLDDGRLELLPNLYLNDANLPDKDTLNLALRSNDLQTVDSEQGVSLVVKAVSYLGGIYHLTAQHTATNTLLYVTSAQRYAIGDAIHVALHRDYQPVLVGN